MSTAGALTDRPKNELATLAKRRGVHGWESMNKADLVKALTRSSPATKKPAPKAKPAKVAKPVKVSKPVIRVAIKPAAKLTVKPSPKAVTKKPAPKPAGKPLAKPVAQPVVTVSKALSKSTPTTNGKHKPAEAPASTPTKLHAALAKPTTPIKPAAPALAKPAPKDIPAVRNTAPQQKDRIFLAVNDPYWLHVMWDLSPLSVQRAEAALRQDWYGAKLIIRLSDVTSVDTTSTSETPIRDIPVEGDGRNWFIHVVQPPRQYRVDIGYLSRRGDFFVLARSNVVTPPRAGTSEALDAGWNLDAKQYERTLARSTGFESTGNPELREFFEERLKRSLGPPKEVAFGSGATPPGSMKKFFFEVDAKLFVYGRTDPSAHLTLGNDPIKLNHDGTFVMTFSLPDSRQIIPAVATSSDGVEERTIVLAVERNTKYLDPMIHDQMTEG